MDKTSSHRTEEPKTHPYVYKTLAFRLSWLMIPFARYLKGNFAPIHKIRSAASCDYIGAIPGDLVGGQYVRNGGNPVTNNDLGRDAHWFDGDGMLSGVFFKTDKKFGIQPQYVNRYVLTDAFLAAEAYPELRIPILPSIATLINPKTTLGWIVFIICRTLFLILRSCLKHPSSAIKKISVANTNVIYHDGRVLATCESGPPMRVSLPSLDTVGWFNGWKAEGEPPKSAPSSGIGGPGISGFLKEWTTAHVSPVLISYLSLLTKYHSPGKIHIRKS